MAQEISLKNINRIAIPAIFAGIVEPFIALSDTLIAGNLDHSELYLGVVGLVGAFISALVWILAQTKTAISTYVSQALGADMLMSVRPLFTQLFVFNLVLSLILAVSTYFLADRIFYLQNARGELLEYATEFYKIRVWGFPLTLLTFTIFGAFRGMQNTLWAMIASVSGGLLNIFLNYFMAVYLEMGLVGIAYASIIAQAVMFLIAFVFLFKYTPFRLRFILPIHSQLKGLLTMSFNLFIRASFLNLCFWVSNYFATSYGETSLATHSIFMQIWLLSAFFLDGYSNAANAISGKLFGAREFEVIEKLTFRLIRIMLWVSLGIMIVLGIGYTEIVKWFTPNIEIWNSFYHFFWILILMQPINAMAFLYDGIYKGMGKAQFLRNILFFATMWVYLPAVFLFNQFWQSLLAVWLAIFLWMIARSVPLMINLRKMYSGL